MSESTTPVDELSEDAWKAMEATYGWRFDIENRDQIRAQWLAAQQFFSSRLTQATEALQRKDEMYESASAERAERAQEVADLRGNALSIEATLAERDRATEALREAESRVEFQRRRAEVALRLLSEERPRADQAERRVQELEGPPSDAEIEATAKAIKARCCSFSDGDGSGGHGWAESQYKRVAREILIEARSTPSEPSPSEEGR